MGRARPGSLLLWLPGIALAVIVGRVALEGPRPGWATNAVVTVASVLLTWAAAAAVRHRYPGRPLAPMLFALAALQAAQSLVSSTDALLFTLGRASRPGIEVLLAWVMLAFPSGRLNERVDRALVATAAALVIVLWVPGMMFSPRIPLVGPHVLCGDDCPTNLLFVSDRPALAAVLFTAFRGCGALLLGGVAARLAYRLRRATPLMRRVLAPVLVVSIARLVVLSAFLMLGVAPPTWAFVATYLAVPAAIAYGLLQGRLWIARALQQLVTGQRARPDRHALRDSIARALNDPSLEVGYWLPEASRWVDADDRELRLPSPADPARAVRMVNGDRGEASAVLVHDAALLEEPSLVEAVAGSMRLALTSHQLEAALQATRLDAAQAAASERQRIERDLHDGAQQRLIALRMKLGVAQRLLGADPVRAAALLAETGPDIDAALKELRDLAHGVAPHLLVEQGLASALADLARRFGRPVDTEIEPVGRIDPAAEQAVYFCCAEGLQNAAKHAGAQARVRLMLCRRGADELRFAVADDGCGGATQSVAAGAGHGLENMRRRLIDIGGRLDAHAQPGGGFVIEGTVPLPQTA